MFRLVSAFTEHQAVLVQDAIIRVHIGIGVLHLGNIADGFGLRSAGIVPAVAPFRRHQGGLIKSIVLRHFIQRDCRRINGTETALWVIFRRHIDKVHFTAETVVRMGYQHTAVHRSALCHYHDRTGFGTHAHK